MPDAARKICRHCSRLAEAGSNECSQHAGRASRDYSRQKRTSEIKRFYDKAQWRSRTVPFILGRDPLCQLAILCGGVAASTDVDHIIRAEVYIEQHPYDPSAFYDPDNLRGACRACHAHKTALEQRGQWVEGGVGKMSVDRPPTTVGKLSAREREMKVGG
jgi:5-methylcytosine-specific restriction endonuclease McrA